MSTYSPEHLMDGPPSEPSPLTDDTGEQVGVHECQNADGRRVRFVLVDLDDSNADQLCAPCAVGMFVAIAQQILGTPAGADDDSPAGQA